jgi:hypothetical protein
MKVVCRQRHQGEKPEDKGGRASGGKFRPLPLRFYTRVQSHFLIDHLKLPAEDQPCDNLERNRRLDRYRAGLGCRDSASGTLTSTQLIETGSLPV